MQTKNITIVGVRRTGASIALALKEGPLDFDVTGYDSNSDVLKEAGELGGFVKTESNLTRAAESADILVITTPANELKAVMESIGRAVQAHTLIIDMTELKGPGVILSEKYLKQGHYIGVRPILAAATFTDGRATTKMARPDLFQNSVFCLMPDANVDPQAVETAVNFGRLIGAAPYFVDPMEYDSLVQGVATMPGLVAAALFRSINKSSGWRDILRFADLPFAIATMPLSEEANDLTYLAMNDKLATIRWLDALSNEIQQLRRWIQEGDEELLGAFLDELSFSRTRWLDERAKNDWLEGDDQPVDVPGLRERFFGSLASGSR